MQDDIPDGANRIAVKVDRVIEKKTAFDASQLFEDARTYLEDAGFDFAVVDEETYRLITEPKAVDEGLALKLYVNAEDVVDGSELETRAEWAASVDADPAYWVEASWTEGLSKDAFSTAAEILAGIPHTEMRFSVDDSLVQTEQDTPNGD